MNELQQRLNNQPLANGLGVGGNAAQGNSGALRVINEFLPIGQWRQLLPTNPSRKFLYIKSLGGDLGYCKVDISLDNQSDSTVFEIEDFCPRFIPTNAIYIRASDPLLTGSTKVTIQVMEG